MREVRAKKRKPVLIHSLGFCEECGRQFDVFHNGMGEVKRHIIKTKHSVLVESGYSNIFYYKEPADE